MEKDTAVKGAMRQWAKKTRIKQTYNIYILYEVFSERKGEKQKLKEQKKAYWQKEAKCVACDCVII